MASRSKCCSRRGKGGGQEGSGEASARKCVCDRKSLDILEVSGEDQGRHEKVREHANVQGIAGRQESQE